jgi:putative oxygen-independent coproporphyrinogen III oxidase
LRSRRPEATLPDFPGAYSGVHLYVHVPFCARRCSYCDFAIAVRRVVPSDRFVDLVLREWAGWQRHPSWDTTTEIRTIYLGGGTPSRLTGPAIARLLEGIARQRALVGGAEVTLEANPDDVTPVAARSWRAAGVTRVSLGVQSFDPGVLRWMHRTHAAEQVAPAVEIIRAAGIADLSLDLIFGLPSALARDWDADLTQAFALAPEHLSLYGLTIEEQTPLGRWRARGTVTPVEEDRYAAEFLAAHAALAAHGYEHYEVSNAARPGRRARHNSAYWQRASFIGLGPSAHSGFGPVRQWNLREWSAYARAAERGESVVAGREELAAAAVTLEELYLGLRTSDGLPSDRLTPETVAAWTAQEWASVEHGRIRLTAEGWLRLDALVGAAVSRAA